MGASFDEVIQQARRIGAGSLVGVNVVSIDKDRLGVGYGEGTLIYIPSPTRFVPDKLEGSFKYLFNTKWLIVNRNTPPYYLENSVIQPFSVLKPYQVKLSISKASFIGLGQPSTLDPVVEFTVLNLEGLVFNFVTQPLDKLLLGSGLSFGIPDNFLSESSLYTFAFTEAYPPEDE